MTQEDKQLLLADLCARLPYGVQCEVSGRRYEPYTFVGDDVEDLMEGRVFKPYLRPMSSMTEEERAERISILYELEGHIEEDVTYKYQDWLNAHHLDYRGLIEKGLALEAPEGMYN